MGSRIINVDGNGNVRSVEEAGVRETRQRLASLAWLLDSSIPIPGTRFTVGIDALIGLFPLIGDLIGVLFSSYILSEASRLGAPKSVLMRMSFNIGIEGLVGIVPFAGDLFDAAFKANQRNVKILNDWFDRPEKTERASRAFGVGLLVAVVLFLALLGYVGFLLVRWLFSMF
jgi:Domain of unknown function (DUF4112)